jgi:hypothetical protein
VIECAKTEDEIISRNLNIYMCIFYRILIGRVCELQMVVVFRCPNGWRILTFDLSRYVIVKGKVIPLQAWTGPEGSRRLRFLDFKTIGT